MLLSSLLCYFLNFSSSSHSVGGWFILPYGNRLLHVAFFPSLLLFRLFFFLWLAHHSGIFHFFWPARRHLFFHLFWLARHFYSPLVFWSCPEETVSAVAAIFVGRPRSHLSGGGTVAWSRLWPRRLFPPPGGLG
ncbi:hypothetical protein B0T19DRAFT_271637 [Cercophora scortea]|uniref:Uncharacterized protein n=1 Tax=Cercophora scortea TaxID=314031 RepID=A0AAE0I728_9PEZI|nr:hypothetical protein B0T19DRAFT_271637 [Cercophora scortea]